VCTISAEIQVSTMHGRLLLLKFASPTCAAVNNIYLLIVSHHQCRDVFNGRPLTPNGIATPRPLHHEEPNQLEPSYP
jgi:hypothetical protein